MVHDLLDLPAIRQKRIEPDLPCLEGSALFFRLARTRHRVDPGGRDGIKNGEIGALCNEGRSGSVIAENREPQFQAVWKTRVRSFTDPLVPRRGRTVLAFKMRSVKQH